MEQNFSLDSWNTYSGLTTNLFGVAAEHAHCHITVASAENREPGITGSSATRAVF
jgi:hypothetical protein